MTTEIKFDYETLNWLYVKVIELIIDFYPDFNKNTKNEPIGIYDLFGDIHDRKYTILELQTALNVYLNKNNEYVADKPKYTIEVLIIENKIKFKISIYGHQIINFTYNDEKINPSENPTVSITYFDFEQAQNHSVKLIKRTANEDFIRLCLTNLSEKLSHDVLIAAIRIIRLQDRRIVFSEKTLRILSNAVGYFSNYLIKEKND